MHQKLVTAETFNDPVQAELARTRLEEAGIPTCLNGEATTGAFMGLGGSFATVKLEVREEDLERARELLAKPPPHTRPDPSDAASVEAEAEEVEPEPDPDSTEALAVRAWRATLIGLLPPLWVFLHIYSLWLLVKLSSRPDEVSPAGMRRVYGALAIDGFVLVGVALVIRSMFV